MKSIDNAAPVSATEPEAFISSIWYNPRGQSTVITYGNGATESFFYNDQRGWLSRGLGEQGATTMMDQTYTRNAKGMITNIAAAVTGTRAPVAAVPAAVHPAGCGAPSSRCLGSDVMRAGWIP